MARPKGISSHLKGTKLSEEHRKKLSESHKGLQIWLGKKHSLKSKEKMSQSRKGKEPWNKIHFNSIEEAKTYRNWHKNKRNRIKKVLNFDGNSHTFGEWELLKKQYNYTCACCKKSEPKIKLTEDHIIPLSKGGSDYIENIQPLCLICNIKKGTKIISY